VSRQNPKFIDVRSDRFPAVLLDALRLERKKLAIDAPPCDHGYSVI
jgi:hypothetical protein